MSNTNTVYNSITNLRLRSKYKVSLITIKKVGNVTGNKLPDTKIEYRLNTRSPIHLPEMSTRAILLPVQAFYESNT